MTFEEMDRRMRDHEGREDWIAKIKYKYSWEKEYACEIRVLQYDAEADSWFWDTDWNEGQTDCSVVWVIPLQDVEIEPEPAEKEHCISENQLTEIRAYLIEHIFRNENIMFSDFVCSDENPDFPSIIASLYNMLYFEVTGDIYEYFFHWANKIGACTEDKFFAEEGII